MATPRSLRNLSQYAMRCIVRRTVSENATTLKFESHEFEKE
jgi:hypothetical protein